MSRGVYEFTQGAETEMQALNTKVPDLSVRIPEATDPVTSTQNVAAGGTFIEKVTTKAYEEITLYVSGLGVSLAVNVFLLDELGNRLGEAWQSITADGVSTFSIAWPSIEIERNNGSSAAANITVSRALR